MSTDESNARPPPTLAVTVPALAERMSDVRQVARNFAHAHGVLQPDDVALAIGEACANVVMHAYLGRDPGVLRLTGTRDDGHIRFVVADDGAGLIPRLKSPGHGFGLPLMARVADEFEIRDGDGRGTRVLMGFRRRQGRRG